MLHQTPAIESFHPIGSSSLGPNYTMVCCDDIKGIAPLQFKYILAVIENATRESVYFVTAEANLGQADWGGGSHFLSIYDKGGHVTLAVSDKFADADVFFPEAMRLASTRFGVSLTAK